MKNILIALFSLLCVSAFAQETRYKTQIVEFKPRSAPSTLSYRGQLFYRSSDSSMCVVNLNGTVTRLGGSGGASAGGSNTQIQFNDGGVLNGDSGMVYNKTTDKATIDTVQTVWRPSAGSAITQVLFNNGLIAAGDAGMVYNSTTNKLTVDTTQTVWRPSAGSAITQVIFNNGLTAVGDAGMVYNATTNKLTVDSIAATNITATTFTPSLVNTANIDASTVNTDAMYQKQNGIVMVQYSCTVDPTTTATLTELRVSLPIAANPSAANAGQGVFYNNGAPVPALVTPVDANTVAIRFLPVDVTSQILNFSITYRIN